MILIFPLYSGVIPRSKNIIKEENRLFYNKHKETINYTKLIKLEY